MTADIAPQIDSEHLNEARKRVDAASEEAVSLAMDALHDRAIEEALSDRMNRHSRHAESLAWIKAKAEEMSKLTPEEFQKKTAEMRAWLDDDRKRRHNG